MHLKYSKESEIISEILCDSSSPDILQPCPGLVEQMRAAQIFYSRALRYFVAFLTAKGLEKDS